MALLKRTSKKNTSVVGLDLDPSHVAAAEVHVNGTISVTKAAVSALRPGVLRDGEVADAPALTETLKAMWSENDLPDRVRLGIANQRIVVRTLDLPPLTDPKALASAVRVEAPDHIPMPMDEAVLDFQSLGIVETPQGPRSRVVVVAVRREMVERIAASVKAAGLTIEGIDLSAFAMVRALGAGMSTPGAALYVNVAGLTNVAVASNGNCLFTRAAAGGLDLLVQTLSERRALTHEHSTQWLTHVGTLQPLETVEGDPELVAAVRAVVEEGVHQLADTIRNSLNFYRTQENSETVESAILTGPAIAIPGFAESLSHALSMPVSTRVIDHADVAADANRLAVAAGLAVESV